MVQPQRPSVLHASVEGGRCLNVQLLPKGSEQLAANTKYLKSLVQLGGLEPPTSCSTDRRSNQLSYNCILERPRKGVSNGPETRCNAPLWQGRETVLIKHQKQKARAVRPGLFKPKNLSRSGGGREQL